MSSNRKLEISCHANPSRLYNQSITCMIMIDVDEDGVVWLQRVCCCV